MGYKLTLSETVRDLLEKDLGDAFKQYFNGDPLAIGQSYLPAICVIRRRSTPRSIATGVDERTVALTIRVVFNKKDEFGKSAKETTLQKTMENIVEGIDDTTNTYHQNSILGILRRNFTLESLVVRNEEDIEYLLNNNRPEVLTMEADIDCLFTERITVIRT